ncbi:unnamed protein product [Thlaspi arvense]|uniref:Uncharacterized protein n=1 Tax=Thlaspi arvense TaxID=13288 RepID=A0AAU9SFL2_THLAR|nr:unnamed protein product [Thlaspi arvense]
MAVVLQTWTSLHLPLPTLAWFNFRIPKHTIVLCVAVQDRLTTRDCLRSGDCLFQAYVYFVGWIRNLVIISSMDSSSRNSKLKAICKLIFQAVVYDLWKEQNSRLHTTTTKPTHAVVKHMRLNLRAKLANLDRKARLFISTFSSTTEEESFISTWFKFIQL